MSAPQQPTLNPAENWDYIQHHKALFGLSDPECVMIAAINAGYLSEDAASPAFEDRKKILAQKLTTDLQAAIEVELATIPIYLYTYYSLNRTKNSGKDLTPEQIFINEAGGTIMSVAVEEMLHMSLSSNVYFALTGTPPALYEKAPASYPTQLPNHNPTVPDGPEDGLDDLIPIRSFSMKQLWRFLLIEYAHNPTDGDVVDLERAVFDVSVDPAQHIQKYLGDAGWPQGENWNSIGQFYSYLRCLIASLYFTDADFQNAPRQQIQSYNYSPNNIDTIYPKSAFDVAAVAPTASSCPAGKGLPSAAEVAVFTNEPDSATSDATGELAPSTGEPQEQLIPIASRLDVMAALETICEQGEGYSAIAGGKEETWADANSKQELSHFDKFLMLQMQLSDFSFAKEDLPAWMMEEISAQAQAMINEGTFTEFNTLQMASEGYIANYPDNPTRALYDSDPTAKAYNDYCSGLFQYMLLMTETVYKIPEGTFDPKTQTPNVDGPIPNQQYFFNVALHRSMIWVLDKVIAAMRYKTVQITPEKSVTLAPTFDNKGFGPNGQGLGDRKDAYQNLCDLGAAVYALQDPKKEMPNYLLRAVPQPGEVNTPSHLPDVSDFWNDGPAPTDLSCLYGKKNGA